MVVVNVLVATIQYCWQPFFYCSYEHLSQGVPSYSKCMLVVAAKFHVLLHFDGDMIIALGVLVESSFSLTVA